MGSVLGKISVETPKYEVIQKTEDYEIRDYPPAVVAEVTYDPSQMKGGDRDGGFSILANYIGALGKPQNTNPEKIPMTAPVLTKEVSGEKIPMTAPVVTKVAAGGADGSGEEIPMTAPVVTKDAGGEAGQKLVTMQFILPSKYRKTEEAPKPLDERVVIKEECGKKYGVVKFSGVATEEVVEQTAGKLRKRLERDGHKVIGEHLLARYNPPWTLPPLRTNEVLVQIE